MTQCYCLFFNFPQVWGEIAQWLKSFAVLLGDLNSVPSTNIRFLLPVISAAGHTTLAFAFCGDPHVRGVDTHITQNT